MWLMNQWWQRVLFIALVVLVVLRYGPGFPVNSVVTQKTDLFTVSGEGKVTVVPDTGVVELGITSNKSSVKTAQTEANTVINNITQALKNLKIDEKDIKTSNYAVFPQYDYQTVGGRITSYQVTASLTVTVREIDKINDVVDAATSNGANTIGGIQLTVDESQKKKLLQQARDEAVKEAKEKATSLARSAGISLGKIVNVVEAPADNFPRPMMYAKEAALGGGGDSGTQIQPGSTDITTSVTLFYETR
jgi:uncharacterized protein YggE